MDIKHGLLAAADSSGNVALVNGEGTKQIITPSLRHCTNGCAGETIWSRKDAQGHGGWMCRMDDTGVYHGHSAGVVKYDLTGKQLWEQRDTSVHGIMFGCQVRLHCCYATLY